MPVQAAMVPSTQRPVPLLCRNDLVVERIEYQGVGSHVIKDPVGLKYHRLQPEQYAALRLLNGERSLEEIRKGLIEQFPTLSIKVADVQHLITDLHKKGLAYSDRVGQGVELIKHHREERRKKFFQGLRSILFLRLPGWDPERTLTFLYPFFRWMFRPWAVTAAMLFVVSAMLLLLIQFDEFRARLPEFQQFFGWPNLMYMWATLAVSKIIHEFGHGLACKHFGGECHEMGVMLLVFSPCLYCDVTDSWMLKNKWKRIAIAAAGMYIEIILSAIAIYVWWNTQRGGLIHNLALNVFFVTAVTTVIFNANPLMRFDGYYMMSDWLEIPNLRSKSDKLLRDKFAWYCLGIETRSDPFMPETGVGWFVTYAIAAALYRWFILFGITIFLYTVLKPYGLQSLGIALAVFSIGGIVFNMVYNVYKIIAAPRVEPMSWKKATITVAVLGCLVGGILMIPLPLHVESAFLVEPHKVQHVYALTPGVLKEARVRAGDPVEKDQVLAVLENFEKEEELRMLQIEEEVQLTRFHTYQAIGDTTQAGLARERLKSIRRQMDELNVQIAQLTIRAPIDGRVVAPPRTPEPKHDPVENRLPTWHGTPLDPQNVGGFMEEGTHVLSIAPSEQMDAILFVDQSDRNDVAVGQTVTLKFDHLPSESYEEAVADVSEREVQFAPEALSNKQAGELATVTDEHGRERLTSAAYQARVHLSEDLALMKPGVRGRAYVLVEERTAWDWIRRWWSETFTFRL
ncbi:MAG: HlyD family efflux transporter periplasmic adaptor subunit [Planctomycetes bacterium]|nr:HlyD family efflux transporter periplasmic adaptor subunit [Planctomycetota bacterium]